MIYPADVEQKLGFDQLRLRLQHYCQSGLGLRETERIGFLTSYHAVRTSLLQTREFKQIIEKGDAFPQDHFFDPEALFPVIAIEESFIEAEDLLNIALSLLAILSYTVYLKKNSAEFPELARLAAQVVLQPSAASQITSKIDEQANVKDNASPELGQLRRQLRDEQSKVRRLTDQIYRQSVAQGWVPEGVSPAIRDGRVVIPVLAEHKRKLRGFIVDESATGQTIFIEPAEVLEANNEIRDLGHAVRREVVRILKSLTSLLRGQLPEISDAFIFLGQWEMIRAKARLAIDLDARMPELSDQPGLNWILARHPLLYLTLKGKRAVVPLTIDLDHQERMLLISGPNAGGKSVCLKTVGLIQYMLQCGLLIPVGEQSKAGIFQQVFLDIGDQQSIENDLSTYSSHLRNLNYFVRHANESTLVLMDELGAGTDPDFGGGIAQAVLNSLLLQKVWGVVTTHYYNLKSFAANAAGIRNGAMLFDTERLEPLFQLEIGKPGSSFALEIARKIGLPAETIAAAENIIGKELTGLESLMKTVADDKQTVVRMQREITLKEQELASALAKYQKLSGELESRKKDILEKAKNEASHLLRETNREIEKTIRHIQENKAEKKETRKVRKSLQELTEKVQPAAEEIVPPGAVAFREGDHVRLIGQQVSGKILTIIGSSAVVQFGDLRSQVKLDKLVRSDLVKFDAPVVKSTKGIDMGRRQADFSPTLDLRGKRVEEILPLMEQFIDNAILFGRPEVKVLHGKGEGVLRKVVREQLKSMRGVAGFADEKVEYGGAGITVVTLE